MGVIIKRRGHTEEFDERKVYASCYAACLNAHRKKEEAEETCARVTGDVKQWTSGKKDISSDDLFAQIGSALRSHDTEAAFMYETHRDIS